MERDADAWALLSAKCTGPGARRAVQLFVSFMLFCTSESESERADPRFSPSPFRLHVARHV